MFNDDVAVETAKLIPFSILRRSPAAPPPVPTGPGEGAYARRRRSSGCAGCCRPAVWSMS